ncbi:hypothetical protein [Leptospira jelokensis]|uniref:hypothetical protein n=1 Tax=Leptospira jelokensis TaxID=2484931 RepID=UPI001090B30E|nr:hypothetical protein [Leptospira jelokensis]TGL99658.1 hypothetical protein EHQ79_17945 [Leptospira jelokensis]
MIIYDENLSSTEISILKKITNQFRKELNQVSLIDHFKFKMKEIDKFRKNTVNDMAEYYWNKALEEIKVELFPIYLNKFELTPRQEFMLYTFKKCKPYFNIKEDNYFLHRYILNDGKGGINDLNSEAFQYNRFKINQNKPYDLIVFLYYFKEFYPISDLILENFNQYIKILEQELNQNRIDQDLDTIHHFYLEHNDEWDIPKLKFYERSKKFYYIFIRDRLIQCLRASENSLRSHFGFKNIGEGYVREQLIYNELVKFIEPKKIKRRFRPEWLNGLELDFFIKIGRLEFAIEHQGEQHVRSIDFFGGNLNFQGQILRDREKLDICIERNIFLFYCYYDDSIPNFIRTIKEYIY